MHTPDPRPPTVWHPRLWVIGMVVIGLHALALKAIEHVATGWVQGRHAAAAEKGIVTVRMNPLLASRQTPVVSPASISIIKNTAQVAQSVGTVAATVSATAMDAPPAAATSEVPPPRQMPEPNRESAPPRFYSFEEVAQPAEPESEADWNLDAALLDVAGVARLVFEIYVSDTGEVLAVSVLEPQSLDAGFRRLLEYHLRQAKLKPATRAGVAVASTRQIEMFRVGTFSGP